MENTTYISAVLLGLLGAGHCLAMCGGIISTLSVSSRAKNHSHNWQYLFLYQFGRIISYTSFGGIAGWLGLQLNLSITFPLLKIISGTLLILMALYISHLWLGLNYLEQAGKKIWNHLSPLTKYLLPVKTKSRAFLLGALWGWLPCGLVYTSLGLALSLADSFSAATFMLFFGLGTLPATLLAGSASLSLKAFLNRPWLRYASAGILLAIGLNTLYVAFFSSLGSHYH